MKKGSIIGTILVILVIGIRWFFKIDHVKDSHIEKETEDIPYQEEIIEPEAITGEEEIIQEEEVIQEEEIINSTDEIVFPKNYPVYGVIENDYGDETTVDEENDLDIQETEKLLMQALDERNQDMKQEENISSISVTINGKTYTADLENNETAQSFYKNILAEAPAEFIMEELNGNEKYVYLSLGTLPTNPKVPETIEAGDIMLYGNNCIVIFYKSFTTNYSYTKIGHIKNMDDLGTEDARVVFEKL